MHENGGESMESLDGYVSDIWFCSLTCLKQEVLFKRPTKESRRKQVLGWRGDLVIYTTGISFNAEMQKWRYHLFPTHVLFPLFLTNLQVWTWNGLVLSVCTKRSFERKSGCKTSFKETWFRPSLQSWSICSREFIPPYKIRLKEGPRKWWLFGHRVWQGFN